MILLAALVALDFTGAEIKSTGEFSARPKLEGSAQIEVQPDGRRALLMDGKGCLVLPGTETLDVSDGATFEATVKFLRPSRIGGKDEIFDGILFKDGQFLLGRTRDALYFNFCRDGKWVAKANNPPIPCGRWTHLAVTLAKGEKDYTVRYYVDGAFVYRTQVPFGAASPSPKPLLVGQCWGAQWRLRGLVASVAVHRGARDEAGIAKLFGQSPFAGEK